MHKTTKLHIYTHVLPPDTAGEERRCRKDSLKAQKGGREAKKKAEKKKLAWLTCLLRVLAWCVFFVVVVVVVVAAATTAAVVSTASVVLCC